MRIIFMGTSAFALPTLAALCEAGHSIAAVYSQPPRPAKRGKKMHPTAVHQWARTQGLSVHTPASLKSIEEQTTFAALQADIAVVAAYGLILPTAILTAPRLGCLNVHGSILPRWRGAAPIQRAILADDRESGVTIMQMDPGLDCGAVRLIGRTPIANKTAAVLGAELAEMGAALMIRVLANPNDFPPQTQQPESAICTAPKIDKLEARLNFRNSAEHCERMIRAFNPAPGAFFTWQNIRFKVWQSAIVSTTPTSSLPGVVLDDQLTIACAPGVLRLTLLQRAGKPAMAAAELLRGYKIAAGSRIDMDEGHAR